MLALMRMPGVTEALLGVTSKSRKDLSEGGDKADTGASIAIVPLTIPLLTGPATISTMIIYADKTRHWWQLGVLVVYGLIIGVVVWIAFSLSDRIASAIAAIRRWAIALKC